MKEKLRRFLGLRWNSPRQQLAFRFENRWLRYVAYGSLLGLPLLLLTLPPVKIALIVPWIILLCVAAYYGHLVFRRFQLSLLAFMALVLLWGHSSAIIWVAAGWEAGLTMFLAAGALLGYAIAWGQSVVHFCKLRGKPAHAGLVALGALTPVAFFALLFGCLLLSLAAFYPVVNSGWFLTRGVLSLAFGLLVLIPAFRLTHRCRLAAGEVLVADSATIDASADATPAETKSPVLGNRAHATWIVLHKPRWPLVLVVIFCGGFVPYVSLVARGMSLARRNELVSRQALLALAPKPVPDAENAAVLWRDAFTATTGNADKIMYEDWCDEATFAAGGVARTLLAASAKAFPWADKAADRERCDWGVQYEDDFNTLLPHLGPMRDLAKHLAVRARVAAYDGDWATVHRSLRTMCAGADDAARDPIAINYLVAIAIEAIATESIEAILSVPGAVPTEKDIQLLEKLALERLRPGYKMSDALHGAREMGLATIDRLAAGRLRILIEPDLRMITNDPGVINWYGIFYAGDREAYKASMDAIIAVAKEVTAGRRLHVADSSQELSGLYNSELSGIYNSSLPHWVASYLLGQNFTFIEASVQRKLRWRLALLGLAVKRHALAHGGAWPAALAELGFDAQELVDPFDPDGKPIRYRVDIDGSALLWSVGLNRKDDGGNTKGYADIGFRLYAPAGTE